ncbi:MAG: anhydro-N-acetylmuramic acid kinase [Bacteroidota bacterium]
MHPHIQQLYQIAQKRSRIIIGLMSGTSLDGLDVALCKITGSGVESKIQLLHFKTIDYSSKFRQHLQSVFAKRQVDLEKLTLLHAWIGQQHGRMVKQCLEEWKWSAQDVDLIASHGQTIFHAPKAQHQQADFTNATLQIGDADHLAFQSGLITISDFRQKHVASGGEGAPLALYGDCLIFGSTTENRILLNLGGIANFTYLPQSPASNALISTDAGPSNTLMDAYVRRHFPHLLFDQNAELALAGKVNPNLVEALMDHSFFQLSFPKTTGPELFNLHYLRLAQQKSGTLSLAHEDVLASLNRFSAKAIATAIKNVCGNKDDYIIYASGGGIHNPLLRQNIQALLPQVRIQSTLDLGIPPDAKEAVLFALLANECVAGQTSPIGHTQMGIPAVTMGKISFPD